MAKKGYTAFAKEAALLLVAIFVGFWAGNFIGGYFGLGSVPMPSLGVPIVLVAVIVLLVHGWLRKRV